MLSKTHLAFGFLVGLLIMPFFDYGNKFVYFAIVLLASLLPDIDTKNSSASNKFKVAGTVARTFTKHRGIFHTIWIPLAAGFLIWYFASHTYAIAFVVGYVSHLVIDGITKSGINFLHPLSTFRIQGFVQTGGALELVIFLLILVGIAARLVPWL